MKKILLAAVCCILFTGAFAQWTVILNRPGVDFKDIYARDNRIIAVGSRFAGFVPYILLSNNKGKTWDSMMTSPTGRFFETITFKDKDTGYIGGYAGGSFMLTSTDGGQNWQYVIADNNNTGIKDMMFLNDKVGFASGYGDEQFSSGNCYYTTDGGQNWRYSGSPAGSPLDSITLTNIQFLDIQTGYGINSEESNLLLKTTDTGMNWDIVYKHTATIGAVYFWNVNDGIMTDYYADIYKTTDGGKTWVKKGTSPTFPFSAKSFAFVDKMTGYAAGFFNVLMKTTDGGETWTRQTMPEDASFFRVRVFNGVAYAMAYDGLVMASERVSDVKEVVLEDIMNIYPNPANNILNISTVNSIHKNIAVILFDISGREIAIATTTTGLVRMNTSDIPAGTYIVKITADDKSMTGKIVITK